MLEAARETGASLIVVGIRPRTAVGRVLLGSVAQRLILDSTCPVLSVKGERADELLGWLFSSATVSAGTAHTPSSHDGASSPTISNGPVTTRPQPSAARPAAWPDLARRRRRTSCRSRRTGRR
ncbi:universal stress protein [Aeromicrobium sp. UC242_57]|uniref:universal stress protein n=1 Tax=Aeromicrobium sp. UC242_57 TaxID=3374624 RepID=UPI003788E555